MPKCQKCNDTGMVAVRARDGQYAFAGPVPDDAKGYVDADCHWCDSGPAPMNDSQLATCLGLSDAEAAVIIPKLTQGERAMYEHMDTVAHELNLWQAGLGPKPAGVIVCTDHKHRR